MDALIANYHIAYTTTIKELYANYDLERDANQIPTSFTTMVGWQTIEMAKIEFCMLLDLGFDEPKVLYQGKYNDWTKLSWPNAEITDEYGVYSYLEEPKPRLPPSIAKNNYKPTSLNFQKYIGLRDFICTDFSLNSFKDHVSKHQHFIFMP